jgi:hypothetical protein
MAERALGCVALETTGDRAGRVNARLHRDLGHAGNAGEVIRVHHVADHEHLGVPGQRAVAEHPHAPNPIDGGFTLVGQDRAER